MKNKILLALLLLAGPVAMAQTYTVDANVPGVSVSPNDAFSYANKPVSHYGLGWYNETSTTFYGYLSGYYGLRFFTSGQPRFVVDINGNVGIGTTTPDQKLSVSGHILSNVSANEGGALFLENSLKTASDLSYRWALYNMTGQYGNSLQFWNYNQAGTMYGPRFVLTDNGNVGIGTTTPSAPLYVKGGANMTSGWNKTTVLEAIYPVQIFNSGSVRYSGIGYDSGAAGMAFWINATSDDVSGTGTRAMSILNDGNVLIGTGAPQYNPAYKLNVNGKVRANEIVVNTTGADFVFEDNYKLKPLTEVEQYIKQRKHLPEIASAQTMQNEGIGVSELQTKLLQKVEELTLYIIQQQKEIDELKKKLNK